MNLGPTELIIILAIVLLLFGSRKLPQLARSLGKSSKEFKKGLQEGGQDEDDEEQDTTVPEAPKDVPSTEVPRDAPAVKQREDRSEP